MLNMETMTFIISLLILSIISAFMGFGFQIMMGHDMIFEWYRNFLHKLPYRNNPRYPFDSDAKPKIKSNFIYYLTKPLGACIICNSTWIGILVTTLFYRGYTFSYICMYIIVGTCTAGIVTIIQNTYVLIQNKL